MAFIPADWLDNGSSYEANVLANADERIARVYVGRDDEDGSIYSILVAIIAVPGKPESHRELIFNIVEVTGEGHTYTLNDGQQTKRFLRGAYRKRVLGCVCSVVQSIVQKEDPEIVSFCTATVDLPKKALAKYGFVCKALKEVGYVGGGVDPYHGQRMWIMTKKKS